MSLTSWKEHFESGSRTVVDGVEMFYVERGEGPPVVLIHGWASSSFGWRKNLPELSNRFRTIALDLPGFGLSQRLETGLHLQPLADHLTKFLNQIGVRRFSLVGHSMGGTISAYLAAAKPDLVQNLVLLNPSLFGTEAGRRPFLVEIVRRKPVGSVLARFMISRYFIRSTLRRVYVKKHLVDESLVEGYYESVKRAGLVLLEAMNIMREFNLNLFSSIECPVLFVLGEQDRWVPYEKNKELAEKVGAKVYSVPDAGHMVIDENPEAVNNVILEFLSG
ncbi:MAG: alpha/beta hydrolase [Candidatus Caldarchaeum sp.]|nr:alpha/beta hydrolase [Candidatus Caldarchaeum sp.]